MRSTQITILLLIAFQSLLMVACSPKVTTNLFETYPPILQEQEVTVIELGEETPDSAEIVGTVKVADNGLSIHCNYDEVMAIAKVEARKAGGNAVRMLTHSTPDAKGSSCHQITAEILWIKNNDALAQIKVNHDALDDSTWNYAKLYVYRKAGRGGLVGYKLYVDDTLVGRMKPNTKYEVQKLSAGHHIVWAKTETKTSLPVVLENGRTYYVKCKLGLGLFIGRPDLELMPKFTGRAEYRNIK